MFYRLSILLSRCFFKTFFALEVKGKDVFPANQPFILAANHLSNLDPPVLAVACPKRVSFMAKEELFASKLLSLYLKDVGAIPIKRGKSDIKIIRLALKTLKAKALLIFPQGTRGRSFDEANLGVGFLSQKAKVPVVAARVYGTDKVLPKGAKFFHRGKLKIVFAKVNAIKEGDDYRTITQKVMATIESL